MNTGATGPTASRTFGELFGAAKNKLVDLQTNLASFLPSMPGMPVGKHFDIAMGIDFEPTVFPPFPIFPIPHAGMVFDLMAFIMGAIAGCIPTPAPDATGFGALVCNLIKGMAPSVKVYGKWIANAGTPIIHLPLLITHIPITKPISSSEMWMGSSIVLADGCPFSTQFHPALSCNLIGFPSIGRAKKDPRPKVSLMAPTSMLLCTFASGGPVLVGGPPIIDLFQLAFKLALKGLMKLGKKLMKKIKKVKNKNLASQPSNKCRCEGEPVDMATGRVFSTNTDFELPGPIPFRWERIYYSNAEVEGPLGYNWHTNYNMGLYDMGDSYTVRLADGRETELPKLATGETYFNRIEKLIWKRLPSQYKQPEYSYLLEDSSGLQYRFEGTENREGFRMISNISIKDGHSIRFRYSHGCLSSIIDSRGVKIDVQTDDKGRITGLSTLEEEERIWFIRYRYDEHGNMVETIDPTGATKKFIYEGHLLIQLTGPNGTSFYWEYEGKGDEARCVHTWGDDNVLDYRMEYKPGITRATDFMGNTTSYYYDERSLIYKIIDPNGGVTRQIYNVDEELEVVINPEGLSHIYTYDDQGSMIRSTNENGDATFYQYDEERRLVKVIYPGGGNETYRYDEMGRVTFHQKADGEKFTYHYEDKVLKKITDREKREFIFTYNEQYDLQNVCYPNGLTREWRYDTLGRITVTQDIKGNITRFHYDIAGNIIRMEEPDGNVHHFEYDKAGNLISAKDELHEVLFTYGPLGVLLSRQQNGRQVRFHYDKNLQLDAIINEGNEIYRFELDGLGQVIKEMGFDGLERTYLRDGAGRVKKVLRPAGKWTEYRYDGVGNMIEETHYDGTRNAYRYNPDGFLMEALNEEGKVGFKRDKSGRILQEIQGEHSITHHYHKNGYETRLTSSLGADIRFDYDMNGELSSLQAGADWQIDWKRDNTGLEIFRQLSGGVAVRTERDRFGREIQKSVGVRNIEQSHVSYNWGMANRLLGIYNEKTGTHTHFDYDAYDNLIRADYTDHGKATETIYRAPDRIGNLFEQPDRKDRRYGTSGKLLEDTTYYYHYDPEGNLIFKEFKKGSICQPHIKELLKEKYGIRMKASGTGWIYEWTAGSMLKKVINPQQGKICFGYDALGRRTWKEVKNRRTHWLWNGNVPLHEWESIKQEPAIHLVTWVFENGSFIPCGRITEKESYSIVTDYLGTPVEMYNENGQKTWQAQLDIYGRVRTFEGRSLNDCPFRYQGQYQDVETGLYYNRFRYYDPEIGSYISQDPIGIAGNNPTIYGYVKDLNSWVDIFGLEMIPNKVAGIERELLAKEWLKNKYPNSTILSERYIRDAKGASVKDINGSRRRLDFVVVENNKVVGVFEVTSPTADKTSQRLKEMDIRSNGGTHVKEPGRKGNLYDISDVETTRLDVDLDTKQVKYH